MKHQKYFFSLMLLTLSLTTFGQQNQGVQINIALGYANTTNGGGGGLLHLEPTYPLGERTRIGMRIESAYFAKYLDGFRVNANGSDLSYTFNIRYTLSDDQIKPFIGLGGGVYRNAGLSHVVAGYDDFDAELNFGFYPRLGVEYKRLSLIFEYHFISSSSDTLTLNELLPGTPMNFEVKNSYFSIRTGISVGKRE